VKLSQLKSCYEKVKFMVAIYDGQNKQQHFGQLKDAYIRAVDANGREFARCELDKNPFYVGRCLLVFAEVARHGAGWKFHSIAEAHSSDNFETVLADHLPLH
jgi:stress response protein SCP2